MDDKKNPKKAVCILVDEFPKLFAAHEQVLSDYYALINPRFNFMPWQDYFQDAKSQVAEYIDTLGKGDCEKLIEDHDFKEIFGNLVFHFNHILNDYNQLLMIYNSFSDRPQQQEISDNWSQTLCRALRCYGFEIVSVTKP